MKYLTVGTKEIKEDLFKEVEDTSEACSMKPRGGLWLTKYNEQIPNYNYWVDFMMMRPNILFYKNKEGSVWEQPCSVVKLKDNANIFILDSMDKLNYLLLNYPYQGDKFSYQLLSKDYDGIYVDLGNLFHGSNDFESLKKFSSFGVSSLVLFHLDCIDYYYSGDIFIEPFDYENNVDFSRYYEIQYQSSKKRILKRD